MIQQGDGFGPKGAHASVEDEQMNAARPVALLLYDLIYKRRRCVF
jgi:hypothetical protein